MNGRKSLLTWTEKNVDKKYSQIPFYPCHPKSHRMIRNTQYVIFFITIMGLLLTACQPVLLDPPRLATVTARSQITPTATAVPLILPAPTATPGAANAITNDNPEQQNEQLTIWINETSPEHQAVMQTMMAEFHAESGIDVAWQMITPALLPELVNTAVLSDTLPDIILHPIEYTAGWTERGILDSTIAETAATQIGQDTFDPAAIELAINNSTLSALPSDGFKQLWLYRSDWYAANNISPPENYNAMLRGAEALFERRTGELISGLVVPTESNLVNTHRVFEQIALANGCDLIDTAGEIQFLEPECRDALDFYYSIINQFSPPGVQTDISAQNAFLDGRTGLIMTSPTLLTELGTNDLATNTGIITAISGDGSAASPVEFSNLTYLGFTQEAEEETAVAFADYWFNNGYPQWLAVNSERKVPLRLGTSDNPTQFIGAWGTTPIANDQSLQAMFGPEVVAQLRDGIAEAPRWGVREGQGSLITELYEKLTLSVVLQEMLSGYFNPAKTIFEAYNRLLELMPNYQYPIIPSPTPFGN